jgi:hypothetical protein
MSGFVKVFFVGLKKTTAAHAISAGPRNLERVDTLVFDVTVNRP